MIKRYLLAPLAALLLLATTPHLAQAQTTPTGGVGIGTTGAPDNSAALEVQSTTKGLLPPRLSTAQRDAIHPGVSATGLLVYNTDTQSINTWDGTKWVLVLTYSSDTKSVFPVTSTFTFTGGAQTYTVPANTTRLQVVAVGGGGGGSLGGYGAIVQTTIAVAPGDVLTVVVGGQGSPSGGSFTSGGYNGGGYAINGASSGGGATELRRPGGTNGDYLTSRNAIVVAGGGGGSGYDSSRGGSGGATTGSNGDPDRSGSNNGGGATNTAPGSSGLYGSAGNNNNGGSGSGGGGGGGYYGGGSGYGGNNSNGGGGGGGSSWLSPYTGATTTSFTVAAALTNGSMSLTPASSPSIIPILDASSLVGVPGTWSISGNNLYRATGNVGIGTANPGYQLDVSGDINASGSVRSGGNVVTSDQRFKQQVRPLTNALPSILSLRGVRYTWNALGIQHGGTAQVEQVGVLAQEVEQIYPELVSTGADGYKAVNYAQFTPVLIEAIKEQQAQIDALKTQNAAVHAELQTVKAQATATLETFEARLRRLEAATGGQAQR